MNLNQLFGMTIDPILLSIYKWQLGLKLKMIDRNLEVIERQIANDRQAQRMLWLEQMSVSRELRSLSKK